MNLSETEQKKKITFSENFLLIALKVATSMAAFYIILLAFVLESNLQSKVTTVFSTILFASLYYFAAYKKAFNIVRYTFILITLLLLSLSWIFTSGLMGGSAYFFNMAICLFLIISKTNEALKLILITISTVVFLYILELSTTWVMYTQGQESAKFTLFFNIIFCLSVVVLIIYLTINEYESEREKALEQIQSLEDATNSKSRFVANISHELRTPLNGIMGMSDLLKSTGTSEEQLEYINAINISSEKVLKIITQTLDYSQADSGKSRLNKSVFSISETINKAVESILVSAEAKNMSIVTEKNIYDKKVYGDAEKLNHIFENLLDNAVKFSSVGEVVLSSTITENNSEHIKLAFTITDKGRGIPEEKKEQIFDAFFRVDNSRTRTQSGAGLGLAICKHYIELMDGEISVESEEGKGSAFRFNVQMEHPE